MSQLGKIYNIEFQLNAQTGSGFRSSFTKAQQEFARLGKEIQSLNRVQSDVSSYQKQQNAVQNTESKLQNLKRQYDLIQQEITETEGPTAGLEREKAKLEQRISDTSTALERQNQKLSAVGERLEGAKIDTGNLAGESARLSAELADLRQRQEDVADSAQRMEREYQETSGAAEDFGAQASEAFSAAQQALASAGIAAGLHEIYEAYSECVSIAAGFEQGMSTVEALSGSTSKEMQQLSDAAKDAGAQTSFTARQSADAFQYMSLAGWNAQNMLAGLQPILDLSAAANMDLAAASDIVTDYLTAFGLTAQDTGKFVDQMAYAMAHSNTNVAQLGEAYKNVAATAKSMGYTVEDTTAVIMTMADAGVKGGEAGTALNAIMTRLATDTKGCAAALAEYGVQVYDAQGNMQSLSSILEGMRRVWSELTDQEQANLAKIIAGTNQYSALQTIMTGCSEAAAKSGKSFSDYAAALQNCSGTAGRMAGTMLDNLNGQLALMDSAADALKITIGEEFNPELRKLAEVGTDVLTWTNRFVQENPALVKGVMTFTGVMGGAAVAVTGVNAALMAFKALNAAALFTGPVGAILGVGAAVAGVAAAVVGMNTVLEDGTPTVKELTDAARDMDGVLADAANTCDETASSVLAAANVADTYIGKLEQMGDYAKLSADGQREYHNILALLSETVPELAGSIDLENNAIKGGIAALRANTEAWKQNAMAQAYQDRLSAVYAAQADVLIEAEKNSIELTRAQTSLEAAEEKRADTLARMNELQEKMGKAGGGTEQARALQYEYDQLSASLGDVENEILLSEKAVAVYTQAIADGQEAVDSATAEINLAEEAFRNLTGAVEEQSSALPELDSALLPVQNRLAELAAAYGEAYNDAYKSISGQMGLFEQMSVEVDTSVNDMIASLDSQISYMATYSENLRKAAELGLSEGLLAQLSDGSTQSAAYLQAIVDGGAQKIEELNAAFAQVEKGREAFSGTVAEIQTGLADALAEMEQDVRESVETMSLPDEASRSARETILAFIAQADAMLPQVQNAYAALGQTAANALRLDLHNTSRGHSGDAGNVDMNIGGYASGTSNAPPGWAWVGEEGPELIHMRGGESVLPTEVSRQFAILTAYGNNIAAYADGTGNASPMLSALSVPADSSSPAKIDVHIHIDGNASQETVDALREYGDEFAEKVIEVMERERMNARRRDWS